MASSDLDQLVEMGFEQERAQLAVTKGGGRMCLSYPVTAFVVRSLTRETILNSPGRP